MKVYVITEGDYSDYHIVGVTLDWKKAEAYCRVARSDLYAPEVEEFDTDLFDGIEGRKPYSVIRYKDGRVEAEELDGGYFYEIAEKHNVQRLGYTVDDNWIVHVLAEDEAHARKIGIDYIMQAKYLYYAEDLDKEQENEEEPGKKREAQAGEEDAPGERKATAAHVDREPEEGCEGSQEGAEEWNRSR